MPLNSIRKICYVIYNPHPGPNMEYFSQVVAKSGYDVTMVLFKKGDKEEDYSTGDRRRSFIIQISRDKHSLKNKFLFLSTVASFLDENCFDIVHIHNSCPFYGLLRIFAKTNAKFIYHSMSFPLTTSRYDRNKQMLIISLMSIFMNLIIFQSEEAKDNWLGMGKSKKTTIIPVGYSGEVFYPVSQVDRQAQRKEIGIDEHDIVTVFTGALNKLRKLHKIILAFEKVIKVCPETRLIMIGDGDDLKNLEKLSYSLGLKNNVIFTGRIHHDDVRKYLSLSDIGLACVPTDENYTFNPPLKTFEFLACGLPTIATNTVSNSRIIKENYNGILVSDTAEAIATAIVDLIKDEDKLERIKINTTESIKKFEFEVIVKNKLIPLYESLV